MEQHGIASFHIRKRDDIRATRAIAGWLRKALPTIEVRDVTDDAAYWKRDIDLVCRFNEHCFTIEVKADQLAAATGNLFLETVSVEAKPSSGWLMLTQADLLFYHCAAPPTSAKSPYCKTDCLYVLLPDRLRDWFAAERRRLLHGLVTGAGRAARDKARTDKRAFDQTWHIRATHTVDPETGHYQHTTVGWTVPLDYVNERYFGDTYAERADQMRQLMVIPDVVHHLDALAEVVQRYVVWARRQGEPE